MEFDKSRVYTALNADELKAGSKVIVADSIACLEDCVTENCNPVTLSEVRDSEHKDRFAVLNDGNVAFNLAYLVEEPEEKKLKWTDLKVGDVIRNEKEHKTAMVVQIDEEDCFDLHIFAGDKWLDVVDFEYWEKVEVQP